MVKFRDLEKKLSNSFCFMLINTFAKNYDYFQMGLYGNFVINHQLMNIEGGL